MNRITLPSSGRMAVYTEPNAPFVLESYPLRAPSAKEALVRVSIFHHLPIGHSLLPRPPCQPVPWLARP